MRRLRWILLVSLVGTFILGCGGGAGGPITPPAANDEVEPNDYVPQSVGTLTATDIVLSAATANASDVDLFRVTTTTAAALLVQLDWGTSSDLELTISNASGIFVRHVDGSGHPESCTLSGLAPGAYTVRVGSFTNAATNYTLRLGQR